MLDRDAIEALIPHRGAMCLLERIVEWDKDRVVLATATHRSPSNPLRLDGRVRAIHLCEYGAQAMAVHGGLCAQAEGKIAKPGFLVSLRDVRLHIDYIDQLERDLRVAAQRLMETSGSWQYAFTIEHDGGTLATGRAAVVAQAAANRAPA